MNNLNKTYHKGKYRSGEWAKHLRPYLKRVGNKRWRKNGKEIELNEIDNLKPRKKYSIKRHIKVKITKKYYGDLKWTTVSKYRTLRDAQNAMKQANVIKAEIIEK
ncbi:hypothetical protein [Tenacibaculum aquimarinum]|uniref:hypothetical protein n=1 Tax=Tenacibaculum aquimarinum TaxID=2910675 RepID=UPI001F0AE5A9|nr:hypothetical protein [Tenacibaculum aquimarinum]MCH3885460.1 hypothetical protein [Tenacibaculum aquimarinum]